MPDSQPDAVPPRYLFLMRHGEAGHPGGTRDRDRPLTTHGQGEVRAVAARLRSGDWPIDAGVSSDAVRAYDTLSATGLLTDPTAFGRTSALWDATPDEVLTVVRTTSDKVGGLLVVGHAPSIPGLARELARSGSNPPAEREMDGRYPTAAVAVLRFSAPWAELASGTAELVEFLLPGRP